MERIRLLIHRFAIWLAMKTKQTYFVIDVNCANCGDHFDLNLKLNEPLNRQAAAMSTTVHMGVRLVNPDRVTPVDRC